MGIYLDNAATSFPKPNKVIDVMCEYMRNNGATAGRGAYEKAMSSDKLVYDTRKEISNFFNHSDYKSVIFTSNITESLNVIINGIVKNDDHVITSSLEHNAVWRVLKTLERDKNITVDVVECCEKGYTNPNDVKKLIRHNTSLIIFNHASNVIGTIQPIREIGKIARENNIPFVVDTAQTAGAHNIDMREDNIDILAFTGHKSLLGPMGIGGFVLAWDGDFRPFKAGGTGGDSKIEFQPEYLPNKFETGTPNVPGIIGLKEGIKYINEIGLSKIIEKEKKILQYALTELNKVKNIEIYGPQNVNHIANVIAFNVKGKSSEDIAYHLDQNYAIMLRIGLHCAPTAHRVIGTQDIGAIRIGIGYFNEKEDIDMLIKGLNEIIEKI